MVIVTNHYIITIAIIITTTGYKNENMLSDNCHSLNIVGLEMVVINF